MARHGQNQTECVKNTGYIALLGLVINIKYPLYFQFNFLYSDTLGKILGFRNPGELGSITDFNYEITNYNKYLYENEDKITTNNKINLNDINYILLSCNLLNNSNENKSSFIFNKIKYFPLAKIYLNNLGSIVYNNHINLINKLDYVIPDINEIEFIFHDIYGNLYDFGNIDHSFILNFAIEKIEDRYTNINTNTGLSSVNTSTQKVSIDNDEYLKKRIQVYECKNKNGLKQGHIRALGPTQMRPSRAQHK